MGIFTKSLLILISWTALSVHAAEPADDIIVIKKKNYRLLIRKEKFAFSFQDAGGHTIADFHRVSGICIAAPGEQVGPVTKYIQTVSSADSLFSCILENAKGLRMRVEFHLSDALINLKVAAEKTKPDSRDGNSDY